MGKDIKVVLIENVRGLGKVGEERRVKMGYAANFLIPEGKAMYITPDNLNRLKSYKEKEDKRIAELKVVSEATIKQLEGKSVEFVVSTHDDGKLYGSVSTTDVLKRIHQELKVDIDKNYVAHPISIKEVGTFKIEFEFPGDLMSELPIIVKSDKPVEESKKKATAKKEEAAAEEVAVETEEDAQ